jgi:hypothetical protein
LGESHRLARLEFTNRTVVQDFHFIVVCISIAC